MDDKTRKQLQRDSNQDLGNFFNKGDKSGNAQKAMNQQGKIPSPGANHKPKPSPKAVKAKKSHKSSGGGLGKMMTAFNIARHPIKGTAKWAASAIVAYLGIWLFVIIAIAIVIIGALMFTSMMTDDDDDCSSDSGGTGTYSADFKIVGIVNNHVSTEIEKWCASKHLDAAQTAAILGSAMQESTMGNATSNLLGWSNSAGTTADHSHDTNDVASYMNDFCENIGNLGHDWQSFDAFRSKTKGESPADCEKFWGTHIEVCADWGSRVSLANQYYSKISGGHSDVTTSDDTASSGSSSGDCDSGGGGDSTDGSDILAFVKKYVGLGYTLGGDSTPISERKPKSEVHQTDCNKFVWAVMKACGYDVPSTIPGDCDDSIARLHKYKVSASQTHTGSLAICTAHAMILESKWHGSSTKVAQECISGGVSMDHTFGWTMSGVSTSGLTFFNVPKKS